MIRSSTDVLQIGGPQVLNEGTDVNYSISLANSFDADLLTGTYYVSFDGILYPQWINCGDGIYLDLVVGNATASSGASCFNVLSNVSQFNVKMNLYGFLDGYRFVETTGETNDSST
jgi:hypothetical protein